MQLHPRQQPSRPHACVRGPSRQEDQPRPRAQRAHAPADAEQGRANDQGGGEVTARRQRPRRSAQRRLSPHNHRKRHQIHRHGTAHDAGQGRIPVTHHVQEATHLGGVQHARQSQPASKRRAARIGTQHSGFGVRCSGAHPHDCVSWHILAALVLTLPVLVALRADALLCSSPRGRLLHYRVRQERAGSQRCPPRAEGDHLRHE
mmetsp:Transcript_27023/g.86887  ORF Transcript_27023/g.86887 Transcript_27023/m.86887 type:complete len:204 (+) Transcript_27023:132-743(+)